MTASERSLTRRLQEDRERLIDALEAIEKHEPGRNRCGLCLAEFPCDLSAIARAVLASVKEGK